MKRNIHNEDMNLKLGDEDENGDSGDDARNPGEISLPPVNRERKRDKWTQQTTSGASVLSFLFFFFFSI